MDDSVIKAKEMYVELSALEKINNQHCAYNNFYVR